MSRGEINHKTLLPNGKVVNPFPFLRDEAYWGMRVWD